MFKKGSPSLCCFVQGVYTCKIYRLLLEVNTVSTFITEYPNLYLSLCTCFQLKERKYLFMFRCNTFTDKTAGSTHVIFSLKNNLYDNILNHLYCDF